MKSGVLKRILYLLVVLSVVVSAAGCLELEDDKERTHSSSETSEKDGRDVIIQALDKKDPDMLKSVFSRQALKVCKDLDTGIRHIFDIYKGSFEKIVYQNTSVTKHYEGTGLETMAEPVFVFRTTAGKYYKLRFTRWKCADTDPDKDGVYSIYFFECEADAKGAGGGPYLAGIDYPERKGVDNAIGTIVYSFTRGNPKVLKEIIAEDVLNKDNNSEKIDNYIKGKGMMSYSAVGEAWAEISTEKEEGYFMAYTRPNLCVYVIVRDEKIISLKVTELEKGIKLRDQDVTLSEPGIVLPEI